MSKTVSSFEELEAMLCEELSNAMNNAKNKVEQKFKENVQDYYSMGDPIRYKRTYTLPSSPTVDNVSKSGNHVEFYGEMNEGISYTTGTFSGAQVIEATENGTAGTLGKHGYFAKTEQEIPEIVASCLKQYFS